MKMNTSRILTTVVLFVLGVGLSGCATSAGSLNREADHALGVFSEQVNGSEVFLNQAAGYLVFPRVIKAGAVAGGETGEGVLRVGGSTVAYYRTTSGSIGFQFGAQGVDLGASGGCMTIPITLTDTIRVTIG